MDYFDYIKDIKPNDDLKSKTKARIQLEISKQNIKSRTAKRATISIAACLIMLAVSVFTVKAVTKNSEYIDSTSETKTTFEQTISVHTTTDEEPQTILIGNTIYQQYQTEDKIEINKSDIGRLIDRISESNLANEMKSLAEKKSNGQNKFQNAEIYEIKTYEKGTAVLVKEKDKEEYYLFYRTEQQ